MPIPEIDKWRAASLLVARHGTGAVQVAMQRADEMGSDAEGRAIWLAVRKAVEELLRQGPNDSERMN